MKINKIVWNLLNILESEILGRRRYNHYAYFRDINISEHIRLEQDRDLRNYQNACRLLFVSKPSPVTYREYVFWQLREVYRITNTALASSSSTLDPFRARLEVFKEDLEAKPYLKDMLEKIDSGVLSTELVCSGHGVWHREDGEIDLSITRSNFVVYSGPGACITNGVGVDIENEQFILEKVIVTKRKSLPTKSSRLDYPRFFSSNNQDKIPNYTLYVDRDLPLPRLLEPLTGRVLHDLHKEESKKQSFTLSKLIKKFPGKTLHWAACTVEQDAEGKKYGKYRGYTWRNRRRFPEYEDESTVKLRNR